MSFGQNDDDELKQSLTLVNFLDWPIGLVVRVCDEREYSL